MVQVSLCYLVQQPLLFASSDEIYKMTSTWKSYRNEGCAAVPSEGSEGSTLDVESWTTVALAQEIVTSSFPSVAGLPDKVDSVNSVDLGYIDQEIVILKKKITVRVAYTARSVEDWIGQYSPEELQFGIDIEWRPNFFKGEDNSAALLQIAGEHGCMIVQLLYIDRIPVALRELLANPEVKLAGVGVKADIKKLFQDYGLKCRGEVDLGLYASDILKRKELKRAGLVTLCNLVLEIPIKKSKRLTMSNWAVEGLSLPQITYAATDACVAYSLLATLNVKLAERMSSASVISSPRAN